VKQDTLNIKWTPLQFRRVTLTMKAKFWGELEETQPDSSQIKGTSRGLVMLYIQK